MTLYYTSSTNLYFYVSLNHFCCNFGHIKRSFCIYSSPVTLEDRILKLLGHLSAPTQYISFPKFSKIILLKFLVRLYKNIHLVLLDIHMYWQYLSIQYVLISQSYSTTLQDYLSRIIYDLYVYLTV